jgi:acyl-coenzyme A thioesterase PaaI-like protein
VRVVGDEHPFFHSLKIGMSENDAHHPFAQALAAPRWQDEDVGQISEGRVVRYGASEADLRSGAIEPKGQRVSNGLVGDAARAFARPIGILAQKPVNQVQVQSVLSGTDGELSALPLLHEFIFARRSYSSARMPLAVTEDEIRQLLAEVAFAKLYGFKLLELGDGESTLEVPFQAAFERPGGIVSGPVFMAAADVAMWVAIKTRLGLSDGSVTVEMKTSFLSGAKREDIRCSARLLKVGRRLIYGVAECAGKNGQLLTHHTLTYIRDLYPGQGR